MPIYVRQKVYRPLLLVTLVTVKHLDRYRKMFPFSPDDVPRYITSAHSLATREKQQTSQDVPFPFVEVFSYDLISWTGYYLI